MKFEIQIRRLQRRLTDTGGGGGSKNRGILIQV
jgi:hypothetical protein